MHIRVNPTPLVRNYFYPLRIGVGSPRGLAGAKLIVVQTPGRPNGVHNESLSRNQALLVPLDRRVWLSVTHASLSHHFPPPMMLDEGEGAI